MQTKTDPFATRWSLAGAVLSAIAASLCCVVPLLLLALGVGGAWASSLAVLEPYRPLFIVLTLGFLGLAFYRAYRRPAESEACGVGGECASPRSTRTTRIVLWIITPVILGLLALPYALPYLGGGTSGRTTRTATEETKRAVLKIEGMTCAACPVTVRKSLTRLEGVKEAKVTLDPPEAAVVYDPGKVSVQALIEATTAAGYPSSVKTPEQPQGG